MSSAECGVPYDSAKEHYILDIEDRELTAKAVEILEQITPVPKRKPRRNKPGLACREYMRAEL